MNNLKRFLILGTLLIIALTPGLKAQEKNNEPVKEAEKLVVV